MVCLSESFLYFCELNLFIEWNKILIFGFEFRAATCEARAMTHDLKNYIMNSQSV